MTRTKYKFIEHFIAIKIYTRIILIHISMKSAQEENTKHQTLMEYKECEPLNVVKLLLPE